MSDIFLATLGQRPEAITVALDLLVERYPIDTVAILHTNPTLSGISRAYAMLRTTLESDYPHMKTSWEEIRHADDKPLIDIGDEYTATAYFRGVYHRLMLYRERGTLHLLVSGGRKVMSIYATLAAMLAFRGRDCLWTVHSPPEMVNQENQFHIPLSMRDRVHLVRLPMRPIRAWQGSHLDDPDAFVHRQWDVRSDFLARLTDEERALAQLLERHPHASNTELGAILKKSGRTIENQLRTIYGKMFAFLDVPAQTRHKRSILLELLRGEL